jgi:hypothetical protein
LSKLPQLLGVPCKSSGGERRSKGEAPAHSVKEKRSGAK